MENERFSAGMVVRRKVLGDAHVDRSMARVDGIATDLQRLVTEFAWGDVWTRPGLALRERSLINLGMLIALNRPHELKIHVRGAVNNGLTPEEIAEVVLHTSVYAGFPAALDGMRVVKETLAEIEAEAKG